MHCSPKQHLTLDRITFPSNPELCHGKKSLMKDKTKVLYNLSQNCPCCRFLNEKKIGSPEIGLPLIFKK